MDASVTLAHRESNYKSAPFTYNYSLMFSHKEELLKFAK